MLLFANDGGPLLLAPRSPVPFWEGAETPAAGRVVSAASRTVGPVATDYDRACDIDTGAALLEAGAGWVIAINGEVAEAALLPVDDAGPTVAVVAVDSWTEDPGPTAVRARYAALAQGTWTTLADALEIGPGGVLLMHAAGTPGAETEYAFDAAAETTRAVIGDAIVYPLPPGRYLVEQLEHVRRRTETHPGEYAVLVRFRGHGESGH